MTLNVSDTNRAHEVPAQYFYFRIANKYKAKYRRKEDILTRQQ